ncbi:MAG: hypothetical protein A2984_01165 [Omnitrophica WOR_2 bacterium RIFCSPLOWO2_01_FULL_41_12]|nr:MAG: hypothetical protein A2984_01165 [Omnitrophica WOR_2 bacterium RIFCSPLOWO2_01_FULL_41_12]
MRKICILFALLTLTFFVYAQNIPQPQGFVNDFAGVISQEYQDKLTALISEVEEKTSAEIAVVTIGSIAPYDEVGYARLLFDNWKPGKKSKDNGVLVLLAIKERRWRIETGYGVEGILPDGLCGEIGRNYMVSYFKEAKYAEGLYQGTLKIAQIIAQDANVDLIALENFKELSSENRLPLDSIAPLLFLSFFIGFIILAHYLSYSRRRDGHYYGGWDYGGGSWGGGGFGGGGFGGGGGGGGGSGGGF